MGFQTAGPNEVIFVSGLGRRPKIANARTVFVWPFVQKAYKLSLEVMTLVVESPKVYTVMGVPVTVSGVAQVKVSKEDTLMRKAGEQFISKSQDKIRDVLHQTIEGHQRAILGQMTVEEIYKDRKKLAQQVRDFSAPDLAKMGMEILSFTIRDIQDDVGYLDALGQGRTAQVKKDAAVTTAEAIRDAEIQAAAARREKMAAKYAADEAIANSARQYSLEKAGYDQQVQTSKAESDLAYELQTAIVKQRIRWETLEIENVQRQKEIEVQTHEIKRVEKELQSTIVKPAEAESYKIETLAEANRTKSIALADGDKIAIVNKAKAEAIAIRAKGTAEAEIMQQKAAAWKNYAQAALVQHMVDTIPIIAENIVKNFDHVDKIVMINQDGAIGLSRDLTNLLSQLPPSLEAITGVDISGALRKLPGTSAPKKR